MSADFTWERVQTLNFGVDLNMFDNRFSAIFDWYQRDTKGMLAEGVELPAVLGAAAPLENVANLRTKGWGLQVNWRDHIGEVNYNIGFTLSDRELQHRLHPLGQEYLHHQDQQRDRSPERILCGPEHQRAVGVCHRQVLH